MSPPKQRRAPAKSALQTAQLRISYHASAILATIFGATFWFFEHKRPRILDRFANEGIEL